MWARLLALSATLGAAGVLPARAQLPSLPSSMATDPAGLPPRQSVRSALMSTNAGEQSSTEIGGSVAIVDSGLVAFRGNTPVVRAADLRAGARLGEVPAAPGFTLASPTPQPARGEAPWWAPLMSAAIPGAGQVKLRQDRAVAYFAVEVYGWLRYASDVREARNQRTDYRQLAARVARANLSDTRPVGDFEYYERMEHYVESGVYDASAEEGIQPETNPESYNGFIWRRARTTFWEDPAVAPPPGSAAYAAALEYYGGRAITPEFRWSWRNAQLEQDVFRQAISRSNEAFRRSIQDLGVIIANHVLSTVDAYVSVRVRRLGTSAEGLRIEAAIPWQIDRQRR